MCGVVLYEDIKYSYCECFKEKRNSREGPLSLLSENERRDQKREEEKGSEGSEQERERIKVKELELEAFDPPK